ncbi:MAG TPA: DoxX family protein [Bacteroidia bacterium]|nr:DoxX family protein [Bacteroidia bacterium]
MKTVFLYVMAVAYLAAGIYHFINPGFYKKIMPAYLPYHSELVYISGACEIALALLLLPASTRAYAAWGIIALLIAVFPANIQMAVNFWQRKNPYLWVAILRLPLQLVFIWWAYIYTKEIPDEV